MIKTIQLCTFEAANLWNHDASEITAMLTLTWISKHVHLLHIYRHSLCKHIYNINSKVLPEDSLKMPFSLSQTNKIMSTDENVQYLQFFVELQNNPQTQYKQKHLNYS